jgi:hypothetical protein
MIETIYQHIKTQFPIPLESDITEFELKYQFTLPPSYKKFILNFNGGSFRNVVVSFGNGKSDMLTYLHGINATFEDAELGEDLDLFTNNSPPSILPIGGTGFGTLILLDVEGRVLYQEASSDSFELLESSLDAFFQSLQIKES